MRVVYLSWTYVSNRCGSSSLEVANPTSTHDLADPGMFNSPNSRENR